MADPSDQREAAPDIGGQIRIHRLAANLTQLELAAVSGVSLGAIRDFEQRRTGRMRADARRRLVRALNLPTADEAPDDYGLAPATGLWLTVLGPVTARYDSVLVEVGSPKQRAVLGALALRPNSAVHRDTLIDTVWGEDPPARAVNIIQSYVARLRRVLEPHRPPRSPDSVLRGAGVTYTLHADENTLDLLRARSLQARAEELAGLASPDACEAYESALVLWKDVPACDVDVLRDTAHALHLGQAWAELVRGHADSAMRAGEPERALPHLRTLCLREPLNEPAHALLMTVLAATGQRSAALLLFENLTTRLDLELGILPGTQVRDAHRAILDDDAGPAPAPARPGSAHRPAICQLPPDVLDFTGRRREYDALVAYLTDADRAAMPVAVITGPPGAGKTSLALHVCHRLREAFPDGQLFVELTGASRPRAADDVLGELLRTLGVPSGGVPDTPEERAALFRATVADRRMLVMLDDAASLEQLRPLLPGTANNAVVITSRIRLTGVAGALRVSLESMAHEDAVALLGRIIGPERVAVEAEAADRLVEACARLPLAVRIAGDRMSARSGWSLSRLATILTDETRRLDALATAGQGVRASISSSYASLPPAVQRGFRLLALFGPHRFTEWAVMAMAGGDGDMIVDELLERSLLQSVDADPAEEPRYRLHDLIRNLAEELVAQDPPEVNRAALRRLGRAYLEIAERADGKLPREPHFPPPSRAGGEGLVPPAYAELLVHNPAAWFTEERTQLFALVAWACREREFALATALAGSLLSYQHAQARTADMLHLWSVILEAAELAGDRGTAAHARHRLAAATSWSGRNGEALEMLDHCVAEFEELGDEASLMLAMAWRSFCANTLGRQAEVPPLMRRGLELAEARGDRHAEIMLRRMYGVALVGLARPDEGTAECRRSLEIAEALAEPMYEYLALNTAAWSAAQTGDHDAARRYSRRGMTVVQRIDMHPTTAGYFLSVLGDCEAAADRHEAAIETWASALAMFRERGDRRAAATCLTKAGRAEFALGRDGGEKLRQAAELFLELGMADQALAVTGSR